MKATVVSYRRGRHTQRPNQMLLVADGIDSKSKAAALVGKRVTWTSPGQKKKQLSGTITAPHGRKGVVRARFPKGLPGEAIMKEVDVAA